MSFQPSSFLMICPADIWFVMNYFIKINDNDEYDLSEFWQMVWPALVRLHFFFLLYQLLRPFHHNLHSIDVPFSSSSGVFGDIDKVLEG